MASVYIELIGPPGSGKTTISRLIHDRAAAITDNVMHRSDVAWPKHSPRHIVGGMFGVARAMIASRQMFLHDRQLMSSSRAIISSRGKQIQAQCDGITLLVCDDGIGNKLPKWFYNRDAQGFTSVFESLVAGWERVELAVLEAPWAELVRRRKERMLPRDVSVWEVLGDSSREQRHYRRHELVHSLNGGRIHVSSVDALKNPHVIADEIFSLVSPHVAHQ